MKKFLSALMLLILISAPAFALSDADYLKMKRNSQSFARADRKLTNTWNKLKKSLPDYAFQELQKNQREWVKKGRDDEAKKYIKEGYSRTEAYTLATNDRANKLPEIAAMYEEDSENGFPVDEKPEKPQKTSKNIKNKVKEVNNEDDNYGEIEEERFSKDAETDEIIYEGNYTSRNKNAFMTVIILDRSSNEAEVTISLKKPEITWTSKGWINEDNVLELFDENYSSCQANLTFSKGRVKIETSPENDWDEVLDTDVRLDGVYDRN